MNGSKFARLPEPPGPARIAVRPRLEGIAAAMCLLLATTVTAWSQHRPTGDSPKSLPSRDSQPPASPMPTTKSDTRGDTTDKPARPVGDGSRREAEPKPTDPPGSTAPEVSSPAERIARLRRSLESDTQRLDELRDSVLSGGSEYAKAEEEFKALDKRLADAKAKLAQARDEKNDDAAAKLEVNLNETQALWQQSKIRFEKAIAERKTANETIRNIEEKSRLEREALDKLLGATPAAPPKDPAPTPERPLAPPSTTESPARPAAGSTALPAVPHTASHDLMASLPPGVLPGAIPTASSPTASPPAPQAPAKPTSPPNRALQEAHVVAQQTAVAAQQADQEVRSLNERIELLRRNIESERRLRDAAQQRVDESEGAIRLLSGEMQTSISEGRDPTEIGRKLQEAEQRNREARAEQRRTSIHLDELQTEYARIQSDHIEALEEAQQRWDAADEAQRLVEVLSNPFTPRNVWNWLVEHGPRVLGIALTMIVVLWTSRVLGRRLIQFMMARGLAGSEQELANRANTLAAVLHNAVNVGTFLIGVVTMLNEIGVPVGPVMGGAAVLGLAVAFGAQSLIKDYFTGFMLLLEQQYFINDVVRIGDVSGQVEQITLRMTVLRDQEGQAHFIPHGTIVSVTNMTYNWARAVFDVPVAYKENVDRVIDELVRIGQELRCHPEFGRVILEDPTMLGVDALDDSGVRVKFLIKTRPLQQWVVKREMLRRIKNRFDELGIEIPYPQTTVHIREYQPGANRRGRTEADEDDDRLEAA